jgi:hypothetical protein
MRMGAGEQSCAAAGATVVLREPTLKVLTICTRLNVNCGASLPYGPGRAIPPAIEGEHHGILQ